MILELEIEGPPSPSDMATIARRAMFSGDYAFADWIARSMSRWWMDRSITENDDERITEVMWWLGFMAATGQMKIGALTERAHSFIRGA